MANNQSSVKNATNVKVSRPRKYKVIFLNDDFTTFDFVVDVLMSVFHKSVEEANTLTLTIDQCGQAVIGVYSYDTAKTLTEVATEKARNEGFPLRIIYESE